MRISHYCPSRKASARKAIGNLERRLTALQNERFCNKYPQPSLQELKQLVRPLQSLLPPKNSIEPALLKTTDDTLQGETLKKSKRTKARQPARSKNNVRRSHRPPTKE